MKRSAWDHPKLCEFEALLDLPRWGAVGILESLWQFAARFTPAGNIGKHSDGAIARFMGWREDPATLIAALVAAGWLDVDDTHRLVVHDWSEHCDQGTRRTVERSIGNSLPAGRPGRPTLARGGRTNPKSSQKLDCSRTQSGPPEPEPLKEEKTLPVSPKSSQVPHATDSSEQSVLVTRAKKRSSDSREEKSRPPTPKSGELFLVPSAPANGAGEINRRKPTWLTPYLAVWSERFEGNLTIGKACKYLAQVREAVGDEAALYRWCRFLADAEPQFVSVARFAETHGSYANGSAEAVRCRGGIGEQNLAGVAELLDAAREGRLRLGRLNLDAGWAKSGEDQRLEDERLLEKIRAQHRLEREQRKLLTN